MSVERFNTLAESAVQHLKIVEAAQMSRIEIGDGLAARPRERFDRILLNGAWPDIADVSAVADRTRRACGRGRSTAEGLPRLVRVDRLEDGEFDAGFRRESPAVSRCSPGAATTL